MKQWKVMLSIALVLMMLFSMGNGAFAERELVESEVNPEYQKYLEEQQESSSSKLRTFSLKSENTSSYVPAPFVEVEPLYALENTVDTLPSFYDARTEGKVTAPKNQGTDGVCWAFAGSSSLESLLMPQREFDFSEQHARFALSSAGGNLWGYDRQPSGGGNFNMYAMYLMRWSGPVLESKDPYDLDVQDRNVSVTDGFSEQFHVQEFLAIPNPARNVEDVTNQQRAAHVNLIKQYVKQYGSVFTSIYYDAAYLKTPSFGHYYNQKTANNGTRYSVSNHAVSIVGWDDSFSKENFKTQPSSDGAFIIKNSWGSSYGLDGYFYLSYEDVYAGWNAGVISRADEMGELDNVYQYDPFCLTATYGYESSETEKVISQACIANVFTVGSGNEGLKAVSVYTAATDCTVEVYVNTEDGILKTFDQMTKVGEETFAMSGYHTIDLIEELPLTGTKFAVAAKITSSVEEQTLIPLEMPLTSGPITNTNCTANLGESFMSFDSTQWVDVAGSIPNTNVLLKGYTVDIPDATEVGFVDGSGNPTNEWSNGQTIKASTTLYNGFGQTISPKVFLALYQGNKLIAVVTSAPVTIKPGKSESLTTQGLTIPEAGDYQVRQYVLNSETLEPLVDSVLLNRKTND